MINLYPYQEEGKKAIYSFYQVPANRRLLYVMPTGTGKTTLFCSLAQEQICKNQHVLLVVHRIELVEQIYDRLKKFGIIPGIIGDKYPTTNYKCQVASIQTLARRTILPPADWIIIDECHHAKAESYQKLWGLYPKANIIGFTATPIRLDGQGFKGQFQKMINLHSIHWYFDNNYLVRPEHHVCSYISEPIKVNNGEYDSAALSSLMNHEKYVHDPLNAYLKHAKGKKGVVFCVDRKHSVKVKDDFLKAGITAAHIDSETPKEQREQINKDFKSGKILILTNYDIVSEGYDVPDIEVVILARKTKSLSLYLQWIGRALRKFEGKTKGLILDCAGLWLEHRAIAGDDFNWTLDDGIPLKLKEKDPEMPADIKEESREMEIPIIGETSKGAIINMTESPQSSGEVTLLPITSDLRRIVVFEAYIHCAKKKKHKLLSSVFQYNDYLKNQNATLSTVEIDYCMKRMNELNVIVKQGFWWHLQKSSVATDVTTTEALFN